MPRVSSNRRRPTKPFDPAKILSHLTCSKNEARKVLRVSWPRFKKWIDEGKIVLIPMSDNETRARVSVPSIKKIVEAQTQAKEIKTL